MPVGDKEMLVDETTGDLGDIDSQAGPSSSLKGKTVKKTTAKSVTFDAAAKNEDASQMRMDSFKKISDDLERVIEKDDSNSSVTTDSEDGHRMPRTCREKLAHVLHSTKFQIAIVVLVIVDCILVVAELLIDLKVFGKEEQHHEVIAHVLHSLSIAILSIFLVEIILKVYAMRLDFFKHKMEVFDAVVVIVSFALDVAFIHHKGAQSGINLIVILRLWRVTRIINGVVMSVKAQADRKLLKEKRIREAIEQELSKYREYCTAQEREIEALQGLLRKHGIQFDQVERPVVGSRIDVVAEVNTLTDKIGTMDKELTDTAA